MEASLKGTWRHTRLWSELDARSDELSQKLKLIIAAVMPDVEEILADRGGATSDFTLHDSWHSYRVAELMVQLAPSDVFGELSSHDLSMLLLTAYLHDIGMTPPVAKVDAHLAFVLSADSSELSDDEVDRLQAWLDGLEGGPPLPNSHPTASASDLRRGREVVAGYVRYRHTDLAAEWIEANLGAVSEPYAGWRGDLIELCRSHHFGIDRLKSPTFEPRLVGSPATVLHLRYCACLLRVADVLDFDPERTPPILFRHRDISTGSAIFWRKDQELSFAIDGSHVTLHARPSSALIHHAIEQTIEGVNSELLLSRRLADETNFGHMAGRDQPLPHRWAMETTVRAVITPRNNSYEYIDGTFRPNPERLLELLGGVELYGSPHAAIREMLQNAFDAIREQIARERLLLPDPLDTAAVERLHAGHRVTLSFETGPSQGEYRLACQDSGSGMSREIVRTRFLVGGVSADHEIRALERACVQRGFTVGRTSRFGIGVLSYFLLGSHLTVHTQRSLEAGAGEGAGWTFTSDGLSDFGELRPKSGLRAGTEVILALREELIAGVPEEFFEQIADYLKNTVKKVPCAFEFNAPDRDHPAISSGPGWIAEPEDVEEDILREVLDDSRQLRRSDSERPVSSRKKQRLQRHREEFGLARQDGTERFRLDAYELPLPDGLGTARVHIGSFRLLPGTSFAYFGLRPDDSGLYLFRSIGDADAAAPSGHLSMSWNGMAIQPDRESGFSAVSAAGAFVEIDWTSDSFGRLAVHRNSFEPSGKAEQAMRWLSDEIHRLRGEILAEESESPLALLNRRLVGAPGDIPSRLWWPVQVDRRRRILKELAPPVVALPQFADLDPSSLRWRGSNVYVPPSIKVRNRQTLSWHSTLFQPTSLGVVEVEGEDKPALVWDTLKAGKVSAFYRVEFPPEWRKLIAINFLVGPALDFRRVWNRDHPLLEIADDEGLSWALELLWKNKSDPLAHRKEVMQQPARTAAFLLLCVQGESELWEAMQEQDPDFLPEAWDRVPGLSELGEIYYRTESDGEGADLQIVSSTSYESRLERAGEQFPSRVPVEDDAWRLTVCDPE